MIKNILLTVLSLSLLQTTVAADVTSLSLSVRKVLVEEMRYLDKGMKDIFQAYYSGDKEKIIETAKKIESSFVLKQKLSNKEKHEIHEKLPADFIERDKLFHYYAGMLAHVAEKEKQELVGFYIHKLVDACADCHRGYASHRFPLFTVEERADKHSEHHHH